MRNNDKNSLNIKKAEVGCTLCNRLRDFYATVTANLDYRALITILQLVKGAKFFKPFANTVWFQVGDFLLDMADELIDKELEFTHIEANGRNVLELSNRTDNIKHYVLDTQENLNKLTKKLIKTNE